MLLTKAFGIFTGLILLSLLVTCNFSIPYLLSLSWYMDIPQGLCPQTLLPTYLWFQPPGPRVSFLQITSSCWEVVLVPRIFRSRFLMVITISGLFPPSAPHTWLKGHWPCHAGLNLHTDFISTISSVFTSPPLARPVPLHCHCPRSGFITFA